MSKIKCSDVAGNCDKPVVYVCDHGLYVCVKHVRYFKKYNPRPVIVSEQRPLALEGN